MKSEPSSTLPFLCGCLCYVMGFCNAVIFYHGFSCQSFRIRNLKNAKANYSFETQRDFQEHRLPSLFVNFEFAPSNPWFRYAPGVALHVQPSQWKSSIPCLWDLAQPKAVRSLKNITSQKGFRTFRAFAFLRSFSAEFQESLQAVPAQLQKEVVDALVKEDMITPAETKQLLQDQSNL